MNIQVNAKQLTVTDNANNVDDIWIASKLIDLFDSEFIFHSLTKLFINEYFGIRWTTFVLQLYTSRRLKPRRILMNINHIYLFIHIDWQYDVGRLLIKTKCYAMFLMATSSSNWNILRIWFFFSFVSSNFLFCWRSVSWPVNVDAVLVVVRHKISFVCETNIYNTCLPYSRARCVNLSYITCMSSL